MNYPPSCRWMRNPKLWTFAKTITNQPIPLQTKKDGFSKGIPPKTGFEKSVLLSLNVYNLTLHNYKFCQIDVWEKTPWKNLLAAKVSSLVTSTRRQLLRSSGDTATGGIFFCEMVGISLKLRLHVRNCHRPGCTYSSWVQALRVSGSCWSYYSFVSPFFLSICCIFWWYLGARKQRHFQPSTSPRLHKSCEMVNNLSYIISLSLVSPTCKGKRWG